MGEIILLCLASDVEPILECLTHTGTSHVKQNPATIEESTDMVDKLKSLFDLIFAKENWALGELHEWPINSCTYFCPKWQDKDPSGFTGNMEDLHGKYNNFRSLVNSRLVHTKKIKRNFWNLV